MRGRTVVIPWLRLSQSLGSAACGVRGRELLPKGRAGIFVSRCLFPLEELRCHLFSGVLHAGVFTACSLTSQLTQRRGSGCLRDQSQGSLFGRRGRCPVQIYLTKMLPGTTRCAGAPATADGDGRSWILLFAAYPLGLVISSDSYLVFVHRSLKCLRLLFFEKSVSVSRRLAV